MCSSDLDDPWAQSSGWRMNASLTRTLSLSESAGESAISLVYERSGVRLSTDRGTVLLTELSGAGDRVSVRVDGRPTTANVVRSGESFHVFHEGCHWPLEWRNPIAHAGEEETDGGRLTAPMPGKIVALMARTGVTVAKGEPQIGRAHV